MREIEHVIRQQLVDDGSIDPRSMYIDTTAQEKNVAYPVDTHLLNKAQEILRNGIKKLNRLGLKTPVRNFSRKAKREDLSAAKLGVNCKERIDDANRELIRINRKNEKSLRAAMSSNNPKLNKKKRKNIKKVKAELNQLNELVERVIHLDSTTHAECARSQQSVSSLS